VTSEVLFFKQKRQKTDMQDGSAKQLVTERVKNATNILVTVSANPSVDELSAALGLTLLLNKMDKHATAVFSGTLPPAINFLEPTKTFENTVDSLRDFIIALDKEKADRLRYKVEDDVVRIFITPYRTVITDKDLQFSQGDFNVELIIALGVEKREDLDKAITAHGRILHDATVVTINAGTDKSSLGSIDWQDANASSLCEMLVSISESFGSGLLDQQIANSLLTGIVAATERFSNQRTTPKVMTMAAQLMAAGANQQLIATQLEEAHEIPAQHNDGTTSLKEGSSTKVNKPTTPEPQKEKGADGEMHVDHNTLQDASKLATAVATDLATKAEEEKLSKQLEAVAPAKSAATNVKAELEAETKKATSEEPNDSNQPSWKGRRIEPPTMGGTLNATSEEAMEENIKAEDEDRNHMLLSHDAPSAAPPSFNAYAEPEAPKKDTLSPEATDVAQTNAESTVNPTLPPPALAEASSGFTFEETPLPPPPAPVVQPTPTIAELEVKAHADAAAAAAKSATSAQDAVDQARAEVGDALASIPFNPAGNPAQSSGAAPLPPLNTTPETPAAAPAPAAEPAPAPQPDFTLPPPPPLPDMSTLPPLPPMPELPSAPTPPQVPLDQVTEPQNAPVSNDPGQFKIPGQS
jgi:hypothetical protein